MHTDIAELLANPVFNAFRNGIDDCYRVVCFECPKSMIQQSPYLRRLGLPRWRCTHITDSARALYAGLVEVNEYNL